MMKGKQTGDFRPWIVPKYFNQKQSERDLIIAKLNIIIGLLQEMKK